VHMIHQKPSIVNKYWKAFFFCNCYHCQLQMFRCRDLIHLFSFVPQALLCLPRTMNSKAAFIRISLILNAFLVFYICINFWPSKEVPQFQAKPQIQQFRNLESLNTDAGKVNSLEAAYPLSSRRITDTDLETNNDDPPPPPALPPSGDDGPLMQEPPRFVQESMGVTEHIVSAAIATDAPDPPLDSLERKMYPDLQGCPTKPQTSFASQRGSYWVLENYVPAAMSFRCDESITYTTHGDYTFLDNLDSLTSRWQVGNL